MERHILTAEEIIRELGLKPLPAEGGFYRETYRSEEKIPTDGLPARYRSAKSFCTAIYYLLTPETCSALHRLPSDEIFHFYLGDPVSMLQLHPGGSSELIALGHDPGRGEKLQVVVPRATWLGAFLNQGGRFALMGTTVAPGFDFSDYEHPSRQELIRQYPDRRELILKLTAAQQTAPNPD